MSGKINSPVEQMNEIVQILDDYEKESGLPKPQAPGTEQELQHYLTMSRDEIEALSIEQCGSIAFRLSQYAFYIQRLHNREKARLSWASTQLNQQISQHINEYDKFMKYANKVALIAKEYSHIKTLYKILAYAKQRMERLTYLSSSLKNLSDILSTIQHGKINILRKS